MPDKPAHSPWDNAGPAIAGIAKDFQPETAEEAAGAAVDDQAAFDQLGPLTRAAMVASPIRWSATKTLAMIRAQFRGMLPTSPRIDRTLADMIRRAEPDICQKIRVHDEQALDKADPRDAIQRIVDRAMKPRQRVA